uniref:Uncharacterized protein n=1 Tax=Ditylenchus dipsaci TaxID=166011 RepID=A0A915CS96_9BILA
MARGNTFEPSQALNQADLWCCVCYIFVGVLTGAIFGLTIGGFMFYSPSTKVSGLQEELTECYKMCPRFAPR